jgi:hypothetical protein
MATGATPAATGGWTAFLVLTIAGERLELSRLMPPAPRARRWFVAILVPCLVAVVTWPFDPKAGSLVLGLGYAALAAWMMRHDIARRTARQRGLTGFVGRALISGYPWLAAGGLMMAAMSVDEVAQALPLLRDAALHAILLGFVLAMVFGHAPIIFPALLRVRMPYHWSFHLPLAALHASLALRVAGDLAAIPSWRSAAALGNAFALLLFVASTASAVLRGRFAGAPTRAARKP